MENKTTNTNYRALITLTTVFFFWGFIAAGNSVFIPFCRTFFNLDQFQSQLIDLAFYGAYYVGALVLFLVGTYKGQDLIGKWGYKKSIIYGLILSAVGACTMIWSVNSEVFLPLLFGLFVVGLGFSIQQTSANPFMISLGDEKTGSNRINLGGAINSLGTTLGPLLIGLALFGTTKAIEDDMLQSLELKSVEVLYACVAALFILVALFLGTSKKLPAMINLAVIEKAGKAIKGLLLITIILIVTYLPVLNSYDSNESKDIVQLENDLDNLKFDDNDALRVNYSPLQLENKNKIESQLASMKKELDAYRLKWLLAGFVGIVGGLLLLQYLGKKQKTGWGAMQYPQLTLGMLAIFTYVGVEVAIGSNLGEFLKSDTGLSLQDSETAPFIAMFWGSLMIGRWGGSINAFKIKYKTKMFLRFVVPLIALGVVLAASYLAGYNVEAFSWYFLCVLVQIIAFYITDDKPARTLSIFGVLGVISLLVGITSTGLTAVYGFLSAGLFCSIMWSAIFSLALAGLGKYQSQGSSFLVMMILGGAIIPPLQGKLVDLVGIQPSFFIGVLCFAYLILYALTAKKILLKQGLNFD